MKKIVLFAAVMLVSVVCFAENYCEICGKDISLAKKAKRCAACYFKESIGSFFEYARSKDKNYYQVLAERRARRLMGETVRWNFVCVNKEYFPITLVSPAGEYRLDFSTAISVKDKNARVQIVLRDSAETVVIDGDRIRRRHRGVYILDNVPICLPGCSEMTLAIGRNSVDTAQFGLAAFDSEGRRMKTVYGILHSGQSYDLSSFR